MFFSYLTANIVPRQRSGKILIESDRICQNGAVNTIVIVAMKVKDTVRTNSPSRSD